MDLKLRVEVGNYKENILKIESLCQTWYEETKYAKTFETSFNPNRDYFNLLHGTGNLITLCLFLGDVLVATYVGVKCTSMQDKAIRMCQPLVWCIHKDYRGVGYLSYFMTTIEKTLVEKGVHIYSLCLDKNKEYKSVGKYLEQVRGFTCIESYFYKDIRGEQDGFCN